MKLKDRVAIVTGTSPNIGGGIAEGLAAEGAAIVAVDANEANAKDCAAYIKKIGGRGLGLGCAVPHQGRGPAAPAGARQGIGPPPNPPNKPPPPHTKRAC